jgi:NADH dehydrogenase FAD-containing subunit
VFNQYTDQRQKINCVGVFWLQVMPPFDPEMVEPVQERLAAKGVELCLGDGLKAFEQQVGRDASHIGSAMCSILWCAAPAVRL